MVFSISLKILRLYSVPFLPVLLIWGYLLIKFQDTTLDFTFKKTFSFFFKSLFFKMLFFVFIFKTLFLIFLLNAILDSSLKHYSWFLFFSVGLRRRDVHVGGTAGRHRQLPRQAAAYHRGPVVCRGGGESCEEVRPVTHNLWCNKWNEMNGVLGTDYVL